LATAISNFLFSIPTAVTSTLFSPTTPTTNNNSTDTDSMNDQNMPITGICLVSKGANVPTGYICIRKAYDDQTRDADLMADSLLERKDRFLCVTRAYPLADNKALVLEDIKLINERESPPTSYQTLNLTVDTREKGTSKRTICVKMVNRQAGMKSINDIIFLYRAKRPPQSYTLIGEINGLQMCIKEGTVPPFRQPPPPPIQQQQPGSSMYPLVIGSNSGSNIDYQQQQSFYESATMARHAQENVYIEGIPFKINPKYLQQTNGGRNDPNDFSWLDTLQILDINQIEQKFSYDFSLERGYES